MKKKNKFLIILLGIIVMLFLSFSYFQRGDAGNSGYIEGKSFYIKPKIEKTIKINITDSCNPIFYKNYMIYVDLIKDNNRDYKTYLNAIDLSNYSIKWRRSDLEYWNDYYIYEDKLYMTLAKNKEDKGRDTIWCLNPETGETIWETKIQLKQYEWLRKIAFCKNMVLVSSDDAKIYFLDRDTGKIVRERQFLYKDRKNISEQWVIGGSTSIMHMSVSGDIVVFLHLAYGYIAYDIAADKVLWIYGYKAEDNEDLWRVGLVLDNDSAYLSLREEITENYKMIGCFEFVCVDLRTGKEKWRIEKIDKKDYYYTFSLSPVVVDKEKVYIEAKGRIIAYDKLTGKKVWEFSLEKQNGIPKLNYKFPSFMTYYLMKIGDVLYYPLDTFYAIDGKTGKLLWWDRFNFKAFNKESDIMDQYIVGIGVYNDKLYLLSAENKGENFGYLYVLSY